VKIGLAIGETSLPELPFGQSHLPPANRERGAWPEETSSRKPIGTSHPMGHRHTVRRSRPRSVQKRTVPGRRGMALISGPPACVPAEGTEHTMLLLKSGPDWDFKEKCVWFEIQHHADAILCRVDSSCFLSLRGKVHPSPTACRNAFQRERRRILAVAAAQAGSGRLDAAPGNTRRFIWLRDQQFA